MSSNNDSVDSSLTQVIVKTIDQTIPVQTNLSFTIIDFKAQLVSDELRDAAQGRNMRLIFMGQLLSDAQSLSSYGIGQNSVIHVAFGDLPSTAAHQNVNDSQVAGRGAGGAVPNRMTTDDSDTTELDTESNILATQGFGRLSRLGLNTAQVEALRVAHRTDVLQLQEEMPRTPDEDSAQHLARLEEAWISRQGPGSEFALNMRMVLLTVLREARERIGASNSVLGNNAETSQDDNVTSDGARSSGRLSEFVCGMSLGFFFGLLSLLWALYATTSPKFRLGIVCGVGCNVFLRLLQNEADDTSSNTHRDSGIVSDPVWWPSLVDTNTFGFNQGAQPSLRGSG